MTLAQRVFVTLGLVLCVLSYQAHADRLLSLREAINQSVENDPEVKNAKRSIHIGQTKRSQARLRYLPKVDFGLVNSPQVDYFGQPVINTMLWNSYVGMEQPLYAGGTIKNAVKLADTEIRRQEMEFSVYRQRLAAEATKSYYQCLGTQGTVEQYQSLLNQEEEDLREAKARLAAGTGSRMEVLEVSNRLLEVQQRLSKARADHQGAMAGLRKTMGVEGEEDLRVRDEMPIADIQGDFDTLLREANGKRPELKYFAEDLTYNKLKTDIERGKQKPQLSLQAYHEWQSPQVFDNNKNFGIFLKASFSWENTTVSYQESRNQIYPNAYAYPRYPGAPPLTTYYFPVRSLKYSLFDNSSNKVDLEKARSDRDLAQDRWTKEQRNLAGDLRSLLAQKKDSLDRLEMAKKQIAMAEEMVYIGQTKYRAGMATVSEVLKARALLAEARINLLSAQKDHAVSLSHLYMLLGRDLLGTGS